MAQQFKKEFKYTNIGTVVGTLCYYKPLERKDGSQYGGEFLLNVKGHGSVNVRVPSMYKLEQILENFNVDDRPHVRIPMTQADCYISPQTKKVYINFTSFAEFKEVGEDVQDTAKGNISGEVTAMKATDDKVVLMVAVFNTDKEGNLIKKQDGTPLPPKAIKVDVIDPAMVKQFKDEVQVGSNVTIGYSYINKNDVSYDEFGLPIGDGGRVTRIEAKKLITLANKKQPEPELKVDEDPFGDIVDPFAFSDEDIPF